MLYGCLAFVGYPLRLIFKPFKPTIYKIGIDALKNMPPEADFTVLCRPMVEDATVPLEECIVIINGLVKLKKITQEQADKFLETAEKMRQGASNS